MRLRAIFRKVGTMMSLSPAVIPFFYFFAFIHIAMKALLGLKLAISDGAGFMNLFTPPWVLLMTGADITLAYLFALIAKPMGPRLRRCFIWLIALVMSIFLLVNFTLFTYYRSFLTLGLILFNGAGGGELFSYFTAALSPYLITFLVCLAGSFLFLVGPLSRALAAHRRWGSPLIAAFMLIYALLTWPAVGEIFRAEQKGFLIANPLMQLVKTTLEGWNLSAHIERRDIPEDAFTPPDAPIAGSYPVWEERLVLPHLQKPDILVIMIEALAYDYTPFGRLGIKELSFFDRLAEGSVLFTNFRTVFPASSRSFLSFLCGDYQNTGFYTITKMYPTYDCESLLDVLRANGYRTGFFQANRMFFDNFDIAAFMNGFDVRADYFLLKDHAKQRITATTLAVEEEVVIDHLLAFFDEQKSDPRPTFALYYPFWTHAPYHLPDQDISSLPPFERYKLTQRYINREVMRLLQELEKRGRLDTTLIIVTADHGEGFGFHGNYNHQGALWEEDIKIPLLIKIPGLTGFHRNPRIGTMVDLSPTITDLIGLHRAPSWSGQNLLGDDYQPKPHLFFSRLKIFGDGILDGNLKFVRYLNESRRTYLFDLTNDPAEEHNIIAEHPDLAARYQELLDIWLPWHNSRFIRRLKLESTASTTP